MILWKKQISYEENAIDLWKPLLPKVSWEIKRVLLFLNNRNDNEIGFFDSNNHWTYNSHFFDPVWRTSSVMLLFESILFKPSIGKRIEGVIKLLKGSDNPFVHLASIDRDIRVIGFG